MKRASIWPSVVIVVLVGTIFPIYISTSATMLMPKASINSAPAVAIVAKTLSNAQWLWLDRLEKCESSGNPQAINPKDLDGTPSYGLLQFKPSTFAYFAKRYSVTGTLMEVAAQEAIVEQMILHTKEINWHQQFPDCTSKLGLPPL